MSGVLDCLRGEHTVILGVINELSVRAHDPIACEADRLHMLALTRFLHEYVDVIHHGKEEHVLFPMMRTNPSLADLADLLNDEHEQGRTLAKRITELLTQPPFDARLSASIDAYVDLLREHIEKEERMIFATVENTLDATEIQQLGHDLVAY